MVTGAKETNKVARTNRGQALFNYRRMNKMRLGRDILTLGARQTACSGRSPTSGWPPAQRDQFEALRRNGRFLGSSRSGLSMRIYDSRKGVGVELVLE